MPADMKETIARAALTLLMSRQVKKLTVRDIVEQCHITRQTFYYHFEDIPELFRWMFEQRMSQMLQTVSSTGSEEDGLRCFFVMAIDLMPCIRRVMDTNYRDEMEKLLFEYLQKFFLRAAENRGAGAACTGTELRLVTRYHSLAVLGLLREWTDRDTEQLDSIVHTVYRLMTTGVQSGSPQE